MASPAILSSARSVSDRAIDWTEDAVEFALTPLKSRKAVAASHSSSIKVPKHLAYLVPLTVATEDPDIARRAFLVQAERLLPLDLDEVVWGLARGADGIWQVGAVRRETLDRLRQTSRAKGVAPRAFAVSQADGPDILLRDAPEYAFRRRRVAMTGLAWLGAATAIVLFMGSLDARWQREIDRIDTAERALADEILAGRQALLRLDGVDGNFPALSETQDFLATVARARPADWDGLELDVAERSMTARFSTQGVDGEGAQRVTEALEAAGLRSVRVDWQSSDDGRTIAVLQVEVGS